MRTARFTLAALLVASTVSAAPVLTASGPWLPLPAACECGGAPWQGPSDDGKHHALGFVLEVLGLTDGLEYFAGAGGFTISEWAGVHVFGETAYQDAELTESGGVLRYYDKHGAPFTSVAPSGGAGYFAAFRRPIGASLYEVFVAINNTWRGDRDGQDEIASMRGVSMPVCLPDCGPPPPPPVCLGCSGPPPVPVPEPSVLLLSALALAGCAWRLRRAA